MNRRQARPPRRVDWWRVLGCAFVVASGVIVAVLVWFAVWFSIARFG